MALVSGGRSSLNPNAPLFVPASMRQVEDFSPEWWNLVTTSTWFHDYWLSQHQDDDFLGYEDAFGEADVVDLLPDSIDLGMDEDDLNFEAQFEEFLRSSESAPEYIPSYYPEAKPVNANGFPRVSETMIKTLNFPVDRAQKYSLDQAKFQEKAARYVNPKGSPRRIIQQPR